MRIPNPELARYLKNLLKDQYNLFLDSDPEKRAITVNILKSNVARVKQLLDDWKIQYSAHPVNPNGFIIHNDNLPLSRTCSFFTGEFNYQGIASQLPVLALDPQPGETVLDLTASPGSKSTQIAALMQNKGRLVLNEVSQKRLQPLIANTLRCGVINDVTLRMPGQRLGMLFLEFFDRILVDAPCTALGSLPQKFEDINNWWSFKTLESLSNVQYYLLISAIKAVKVDGIIVYSTCSIAPEENEILIDRLIKKYPLQIEKILFSQNPLLQNGFTNYQHDLLHPDLKHSLRTFPHTSAMEGFYVIKLRKTAPVRKNSNFIDGECFSAIKFNEEPVKSVLNHLSQKWGINSDFFSQFHYLIGKKRIWLMNDDWQKIPGQFFVKSGLVLAEKRLHEWKLTNASVQLLLHHITDSIIQLDTNQLQTLFQTGSLEMPHLKNGYYVIRHDDKFLACVSLFQKRLKIKLPNPFKIIC